MTAKRTSDKDHAFNNGRSARDRGRLMTTQTSEWVSDPRWPDVIVTLKNGATRQGRLLVDRGETVTVEYLTPGGYFECRRMPADQVASPNGWTLPQIREAKAANQRAYEVMVANLRMLDELDETNEEL